MMSNDTKEMDETTKTTTTKTTCWGTWEELLLACAVNRHGSKSWESVAMEIQNRTSSPQLLTPDNCRTKYYQLQRRFVANDELEAEEEEKTIPVLLDELRKLRVQELKREVQRNDASIMSLQLKVKRLTEDRERNLRENKERTSDLKEREEEEGRGGEADNSSPEKLNVDRVSGEDSVRENQSFKESNSTDPEGENDQEIAKVEKTEDESEPEPVQTSSGKPAPVRFEEVVVPGDKPAGEGSYNASSGTIVKELAVLITIEKEKEKAEEGGRSREDGDSTEGGLWESKEAREEEERSKENSDVQSSVSLSGTRSRVKAVSMSSGGDERETEEVSPAKKRISDESEPLLHYFKIVKSNKYGSVFDRRLQSQKSDKYKSLIRLHIDLEIIKTRIDEGHYSECNRKFLRDLLLLINNALTFFPKNSDENNAALELRMLVTKSISPRILKPTAPPEPPVVAKPDAEPSKPVKPEPAVPSRKRSATERKAAVAVVVEAEAEPVRDCSDGKKNTRERKRERERERLASGTRSSRTKGSALKGTATRNSSRDRNPASDSKGAGAIIDGSEVKKEKYSNEATSDAKKRGAAELLDRIKRNSSNGGPLLEKLKNSSKGGGSDGGGADAQQRNVASAHSSEGVDTKRKGASGHSEVVDVKRKGGASGHSEGVDTKQKGGGGLGEGTETAKRNVGKDGETEHNKQKAGGGSSGARERRRRDHGTRSEKRLQQEEKSPPKRNVGRPPKRSAVAAAATTPPIKCKRNGDTEDVRGSSGSRPWRKRTRR